MEVMFFFPRIWIYGAQKRNNLWTWWLTFRIGYPKRDAMFSGFIPVDFEMRFSVDVRSSIHGIYGCVQDSREIPTVWQTCDKPHGIYQPLHQEKTFQNHLCHEGELANTMRPWGVIMWIRHDS